MRLRPRRLVWRIYLHGLLGLVIFAFAVAALFVLWRGDDGPLVALPERVAAVMPELADGDASELEERLTAFGDLMGFHMSLYTRDGDLVARTSADAPHAISADEGGPPTREAIDFGRRFRHHIAVPVGETRYLMVSWRRRAGPRVLFALGLVLAFIGTLSIPLARAVASPLNRLTETARALGEGDLDARTGLCRFDEIGELARAMDDMAERLQRLLARERELLADISHELRTPLARIRVALELQTEDGGMTPYLEGVDEDLNELEGLVNDVLTTARLDLTEGEAGFAMRPTDLDMATVIDASVERFERRHRDRTLRVDKGAELPLVHADGALIRRVIDNLLDNAARYSDPPSLIELSIESTDAQVIVEVRDRGVGLAEADIALLFEPFFRADRSRARATGGVGLGLTLCKRIIDAHGGRIEGRSRPGGGAVFSFGIAGV